MTGDARQTLDLVREGDEYVGWCVGGRGTRIFGGATLSQAIRAADLSNESERSVDALHAIFVAPGDARRPVHYRVTPIKHGRSLDVLSVEAVQAHRTILTAHVTFHDGAPSPDFHDTAPRVAPASMLDEDPQPSPGGTLVRAPFDIRAVPRTDAEPQHDTWIRLRDSSPRTSREQAALLAYAMDFLITRPAHAPLDPEEVSLFGASLDHSMWFHRPFDIREWLLFSSRATSFAGSRSLCHCQVFDVRGVLVASGTQEALLPPTRR